MDPSNRPTEVPDCPCSPGSNWISLSNAIECAAHLLVENRYFIYEIYCFSYSSLLIILQGLFSLQCNHISPITCFFTVFDTKLFLRLVSPQLCDVVKSIRLRGTDWWHEPGAPRRSNLRNRLSTSPKTFRDNLHMTNSKQQYMASDISSRAMYLIFCA